MKPKEITDKEVNDMLADQKSQMACEALIEKVKGKRMTAREKKALRKIREELRNGNRRAD